MIIFKICFFARFTRPWTMQFHTIIITYAYYANYYQLYYAAEDVNWVAKRGEGGKMRQKETKRARRFLLVFFPDWIHLRDSTSFSIFSCFVLHCPQWLRYARIMSHSREARTHVIKTSQTRCKNENFITNQFFISICFPNNRSSDSSIFKIKCNFMFFEISFLYDFRVIKEFFDFAFFFFDFILQDFCLLF